MNRGKLVKILLFCWLIIVVWMFSVFGRNNVDLSILDYPDVYGVRSDSICQNQIVGDPSEAGDDYVKIKFVCNNGLESTNTVAIGALDNNDMISLIYLFGKMFGAETDNFLINYSCLINDELVYDDETKLFKGDNVLCIEK